MKKEIKPEDGELNDIAPNLFRHKKENPFTVPDNYFDELPSLIQAKIQQKNAEPWYERIISSILQPHMAFAIMFVIVLLAGGYVFLRNQNNSQFKTQMVITPEDLKTPEFLNELDEYALVEDITAYADIYASNQADESAIENYLIDNQTDINQLINEL